MATQIDTATAEPGYFVTLLDRARRLRELIERRAETQESRASSPGT